ncbi:hypothetical protein [Peribacillus simplex]|uniref:hypothetical protein n=1 Tax=Peribacillus simplex TaxID=1478 RepID=UPI003D2B7509
MERTKNTLFFIFGVILIIVVIFTLEAMAQIGEEKEKEEILKNGELISALIIDKKKIDDTTNHNSTTFTPVIMGSTIMMLPMNSESSYTSSEYSLKIYANEKNYNIIVPEAIYKAKSVGDKMNIKLYKNKIEIIDSK